MNLNYCMLYIQLYQVSIVMVYESVANLLTTIKLQGLGPSIAQSERKKTPAADSCKDLAPRQQGRFDSVPWWQPNLASLGYSQAFASACSQRLMTSKWCLLPASMIQTVQLSQLSDAVHQGSTMAIFRMSTPSGSQVCGVPRGTDRSFQKLWTLRLNPTVVSIPTCPKCVFSFQCFRDKQSNHAAHPQWSECYTLPLLLHMSNHHLLRHMPFEDIHTIA